MSNEEYGYNKDGTKVPIKPPNNHHKRTNICHHFTIWGAIYRDEPRHGDSH